VQLALSAGAAAGRLLVCGHYNINPTVRLLLPTISSTLLLPDRSDMNLSN
jgi:hypothetical protein